MCDLKLTSKFGESRIRLNVILLFQTVVFKPWCIVPVQTKYTLHVAPLACSKDINVQRLDSHDDSIVLKMIINQNTFCQQVLQNFIFLPFEKVLHVDLDFWVYS